MENQVIVADNLTKVYTQLHSAHDLIGLPVEVFADRASAGAFDALVAQIHILADFFLDALGQFCVDLNFLAGWRYFIAHNPPPILSLLREKLSLKPSYCLLDRFGDYWARVQTGTFNDRLDSFFPFDRHDVYPSHAFDLTQLLNQLNGSDSYTGILTRSRVNDH